jgi:hypothetical protein
VSSNNRLTTESIVITAEGDAIRQGEGWQITSAPVTFTASAQSAILYVKNADSRNFVLDRAVLVLGTATGAAGDWTFQVLRNPEETGTLVSNAVAAGISNSNHGSAKTPDATSFRGVQGDTVDLAGAGTGAPLPIQTQSNRTSSIAFRLTPPPSTTAATAVLVTHWYYDLEDV